VTTVECSHVQSRPMKTSHQPVINHHLIELTQRHNTILWNFTEIYDTSTTFLCIIYTPRTYRTFSCRYHVRLTETKHV